MAEMEEKKYKIFSVKNYNQANKKFIEENEQIYDIKKLEKELKKDNYYNFRVHKNDRYVYFGDVDGLKTPINDFIKILKDFLLKNYGLRFTDKEFKYTKNNKKEGSYHYSIPKWNCSCEKLKEIHTNLIKKNVDLKKIIDTTVYSEHWFRCPNQSKGNNEANENKHIIIEGNMKNFVIDYIPKNSENIENIKCIGEIKLNNIKKSEKNKIIDTEIIDIKNCSKSINNNEIIKKSSDNKIINYDKELLLSKTLSDSKIYKKLFDECYKQERFEDYESWLSIGMAIKNAFVNIDEAFDLFNYYSAKGRNYEGQEKTKYKFLSFEKKDKNGYTIATIHFYAIEDNKPKFIEIMNKNTFELGQTDMCKYLKILTGYKFIYKICGSVYKLYCYNGKYWQNDDIIFKKCISTVLYDFLKMILVEVYWNTREFNSLKSKIEKLKLINYKKDIVETYKEYGVNNVVTFDSKWWLFGFTNTVYDMKQQKFREYCYDDYVSVTCGYDWREPTNEETETIENLIKSVIPIKEERELYLQILCTGIDGRCLEKFIIFNGCGGNGKGVMNDLMSVCVGNYGMIGNNGILFENSKTGSNPEKSNLHKKRFIVFKNPNEKNKIKNSIITELNTVVIECEHTLLFDEELETNKIIDIQFNNSVDEIFKTEEFKQKHKFAFMKILLEEHIKYSKNNNKILLPKSVENRRNLYLKLPQIIMQWFIDNYEKTENKNFIKIKEIYKLFNKSENFSNLSNFDKKKCNTNYFEIFFKTNEILKKNYKIRYNNVRGVILQWNIKI
jgi:hypothetical protein